MIGLLGASLAPVENLERQVNFQDLRKYYL